MLNSIALYQYLDRFLRPFSQKSDLESVSLCRIHGADATAGLLSFVGKMWPKAGLSIGRGANPALELTMQDESRDIPIDDLVEPRLVLRPVDKEGVEYLEMRDSMAAKGFVNSICVRPAPYAPGKHEIVDGRYRYHCARDVGRSLVPCFIKYGLTDEDVLALQIQANAVRPETTPTEFARQLRKILFYKPGMVMADLAEMVHKNPKWVKDMLGLLNLNTELQKAVDRSEMPLGNAYMLAKIPPGHREEFVDLAKTSSVKQFTVAAAAFIKQFAEGVRQGKLEAMFTRDFKATAYLRGVKEVQEEYESRSQGGLLLAAARCASPVEAWYLALQWALHLDPESIELQRRNSLSREHRRITRREGNDEMNL
jgi:ParB/RepB/Spo0J family partition protein